jgi:hypothetical protein
MERTGDLRATEPQTNYYDEVLYTPDYQMENYDLQQKIEEYKMLVRDGGGFQEMDCRQR